MVAQDLAPREGIAAGSSNGHVPGPGDAGSEARADARPAAWLIPALLRPYLDLDTIRYDYPVVLADGGSDLGMAPLADLVDDLLRRIDPGTRDVDGLRRDLYRLEKRVKRLVDTEPGARLSALWDAAARAIVEETADEDRRALLAQELEAAREALGRDGAVLSCGAASTRRMVEHIWRRLRAEQARADAAVLADLSGRISDLIDAERAQAPEAVAPGALSASMAGDHSGVDYEALSELLTRGSGRHRPSRRARRLREPLRVIEEERERLLEEAASAVGAASSGDCSTSIGSALDAWHREGIHQARVLRAMRLATLELGNRYRRDRHDALFSAPATEHLGPEERRALPSILLALDADELDYGDQARLLALLGSEIPLKVVLAVHRAPGERLSASEGGTQTSMGESDQVARIGQTALLAGDAFILQASASQLPRLGHEIVAALRHEGPALIAVYVGPATTPATTPGVHVPSYVRSAAAVESRAFPSFVSDPGNGTDWHARFSLIGDPEPEAAWPQHTLTYEGPDGGPAEEQVSFTVADLLALDPRFRGHFEPIGRSGWHPRMTSVADAVSDGSGTATAALPYVYVVDTDDRLFRAVVSPEVLARSRACAANWARLQALARAGAPVPVQAEAAPNALAPTGEPAAVESPTTTEALTPAAAPPAPAGGSAPSPGAAYIESALCTTCDECTKRNSQMFAYDAQKQAFIKDPRAGTYRELVEAAENCPVCIIHPGQPLDPNEPGLEELVKRAASFA